MDDEPCQKDMDLALKCKDKGNQLFKMGDLHGALEQYSQGLQHDITNVLLYSNRSSIYLKLGSTDLALQDAQKCIELNPLFAKGYFRLGSCY